MKRARRPSSSGCSESRSELANHKERKERKEEAEIRNPKPETRNKSQLMRMGEWENGKPTF